MQCARRWTIARHACLAMLLWLAFLPLAQATDKPIDWPKQLGTSQSWIKRAIKEAEKVSDAKQRWQCWLLLAGGAARLGDDALFKQVVERSGPDESNKNDWREVAYSIAGQWSYGGWYDQAWEFAGQIADPNMRRRCYCEIAREQARRGHLEEAKASIAKMPSEWQAEARSEVIWGHTNLCFCLELLKEIPAGELHALDFGDVLYMAANEKNSAAFNDVFRLALDDIELRDDWWKTQGYESIADSVIKPGEIIVEPALRRRFLENLRKLARGKNDRVAVSVVDIFLEVGQLDEVRELIAQATSEDKKKRYRLQLADKFLEMGQLEEVRKFIAQATSEDKKKPYREKLVGELIKRGRLADALKIIEEEGLNDNRLLSSVAMSIHDKLANAKFEKGDLMGAEIQMDKIAYPDVVIPRDMYRKIADRWLEVAQVRSAKAMAPKIGELGEQVDFYISIAECQRDNGKPEEARQTLCEAVSLAKEIESEGSQSQTIEDVAVQQAVHGDIDGAVHSAQAISWARYRYMAFLRMAEHQLENGQRKLYEKYSELSLDAIAEITNYEEAEPATSYAILAIIIAKADQPDRFRQVMAKSLKSVEKTHTLFGKLCAFGPIIHAYHEAQCVDQLPAAMERIESPLDRVVAYYTISEMLRSRRYEERDEEQ